VESEAVEIAITTTIRRRRHMFLIMSSDKINVYSAGVIETFIKQATKLLTDAEQKAS
jgi:hypothetical protein